MEMRNRSQVGKHAALSRKRKEKKKPAPPLRAALHSLLLRVLVNPHLDDDVVGAVVDDKLQVGVLLLGRHDEALRPRMPPVRGGERGEGRERSGERGGEKSREGGRLAMTNCRLVFCSSADMMRPCVHACHR
jgi:hypothetical protein